MYIALTLNLSEYNSLHKLTVVESTCYVDKFSSKNQTPLNYLCITTCDVHLITLYNGKFLWGVNLFCDTDSMYILATYIPYSKKFWRWKNFSKFGELQQFVKFFANFHKFHGIAYGSQLPIAHQC